MNHVYPSFRNTFLWLAGALLTSGAALAQTPACGPIVENFTNTGGSMAGFSSSTLNSTADGFEFAQTGQEGFLQRCAIPSAGSVYEIVTPTYTTAANQTTVGYGFELSGAVNVSTATIYLQYFDNTNSVNTVLVTAFTPTYTGSGANSLATVCGTVPIANYTGFTPGERYRFVIQLTAATASNNNQCIVFDNFRTTGTIAQITLPVTFTAFAARKAQNGIYLVWNVAGERDVARYEVERSTNGRDFTPIGEVAATGDAAYSFIDTRPANGVNFYRVRNVDTDGQFKYTSIVRVNLEQAVVIRAYPQPVLSSVTIEHSEALEGGRITLSSAGGQVVRTVPVTPHALSTPLNLSGLQAGIYLVRYDNGRGQVETLKIVKQ